MKQVEQVETVDTSIGEPIDAIVALAQECRAQAIAHDARHASLRLERSRLFVSVLGSAPVRSRLIERITARSVSPSHLRIAFRDRPAQLVPVAWHDRLDALDGEVVAVELVVESALARRGVVYGFGTGSRRVDLVLVDEADVADAKIAKWRAGRVLTLDTSCRHALQQAFETIDRMAVETGASRVEPQLVRHTRHLCLRLQHHLDEHQRALGRATSSLSARVNALTIARVLAEAELDARARQPHPSRKRLVEWLEVERTKFLMATKADALATFDERMAALRAPRHRFRESASVVGTEILDALLRALWKRLRVAPDAAIAAHAKQMFADFEASLEDLGEAMPAGAIAGLDLTRDRDLPRDAVRFPSSGVIDHLADRMRLASRKRIESGARADFVTGLEAGSRQLVARTLDDHDETTSTIERRFCDLVDGALESARLAAELAVQVEAEGPDAIAAARCRVARWVAALSTIMTRVE